MDVTKRLLTGLIVILLALSNEHVLAVYYLTLVLVLVFRKSQSWVPSYLSNINDLHEYLVRSRISLYANDTVLMLLLIQLLIWY